MPSMRGPVMSSLFFHFFLFFLFLFISSFSKIVPIEPSRLCRHPSIRTLCERLSLRASWVYSFSRCCYLVIDLCSPLWKGTGPGTVAVT